MDSLAFLNDAVKHLRSDGLLKTPRTLEGAQSPVAIIDGEEIINLGSYNYLGFANHPRVKERAKEAIDRFGVGAGSGRTAGGNMKIYKVLEERWADFKRVEAVLLFPSGYSARVGLVSTLLGPADCIISDRLNHTSIIEGASLSQAERIDFDHTDLKDTSQLLKATRAKGEGRILLVTSGVFESNGEIAKLPELVKMTRKYDGITMVDDSHGSGVVGRNGRGTIDHFNLHGDVEIEVGSFAYGFASSGGYVAGPEGLIQFLMHKAMPILYSSPLPPSTTAAVLAGIELLEEDNSYLERLWQNARFFKEGLKQLGFDTGTTQTPIIPISAGEDRRIMRFRENLFKEGVFTLSGSTAIDDCARVRAIVTAGHTKEDLIKALDAFEKVGKELALI